MVEPSSEAVISVSENQYKPNQKKYGVLLVNLGTPEAPTIPAVRTFLKEFLWDSRVVQIPRPIWWMILNCFILPFRPKGVTEVYKELWEHHGDSPLRIFTKRQTEKLHTLLNDNDESLPVEWAMTYGDPNIASQMQTLMNKGCDEIIVLPLYPQYSVSTTASVTDRVIQYIDQSSLTREQVHVIPFYYKEKLYIEALSASVEQFWNKNGRGDFLLLSYHGIPKKYVDDGDPYQQHCAETTELLVNALALPESFYQMSFQSRLGRAEWLKPYTAETVVELAKRGIKTLDVVCPSFSADCIETLDEILIENGDIFKKHGGETIRLVPCLNESDEHIAMMRSLIFSKMSA